MVAFRPLLGLGVREFKFDRVPLAYLAEYAQHRGGALTLAHVTHVLTHSSAQVGDQEKERDCLCCVEVHVALHADTAPGACCLAIGCLVISMIYAAIRLWVGRVSIPWVLYSVAIL